MVQNLLLTRVFIFSQTGFDTHCHTNVKNLRLNQINVNRNSQFFNIIFLTLKEDLNFLSSFSKKGILITEFNTQLWILK